jgi:hypothetical protein
MLVWSPDLVAAVVAAVSALAIFVADRLPNVWRVLTARSRWLGRIESTHAATAKVLVDLRGFQVHVAPVFVYSWAYSGAIWAFAIPVFVPTSILPASMRLGISLLALDFYAIGVVFYLGNLLNDKIPALLNSANKMDGVPALARKRYHLAHDLFLGWAPGVVAAAAGQSTAIAAGGTSLSITDLATLGGIAYFSYLIYSMGWVRTRSIEQQAYWKWVGEDPDSRPVCEVHLRKGAHRPVEEVSGSVVDIGRSLKLLRSDGFAEELDWDDIRRLAVKTTAAPQSAAPQVAGPDRAATRS